MKATVTKHSRFLFRNFSAVRDAHPPAEDLASYVDALRDGDAPRLPASLASHVEHCGECQGQIIDVLFYLQDPLKEAVSAGIRAAFPARKHTVRVPMFLRAAAALFVFTLLLAFYSFLTRSGPTDSSARKQPLVSIPVGPTASPFPGAVSVPLPRSGKGAAGRTTAPAARRGNDGSTRNRDAFAVNPNLESMVGSRSRGLVIEVYSPPNHVTVSQEITFAWKEFSHEPLNLIIANNRNEMMFMNPVSGGVFLFRAALPPGCYYWKLESAGELYYVGKFFIAAGTTSPAE